MFTTRSSAIVLSLLLPTPLYAVVPATWSTRYETSTPLPGTNQTAFFLSGVAVSGDNFAFAARYTDQFGDYEGVYASVNGTLQRVADLSTTMPDSNGALLNYSIYAPSISGDQVAFYAVGARHNLPEGEYPWNAGIYRYSNGALAVVADEQMTAPGTPIHFYDFNRPDIRGDTVAFQGIDEDGLASGVYTRTPTGALNVIADLSTPVPGRTGTFKGFPYRVEHTVLSPSGDTYFLGMYHEDIEANTGAWGIYRSTAAGALQPVVEELVTPVPNGAGPFEEIYQPVVAKDSGALAFFGHEYSGYLPDGRRGIYAVSPADGSLSVLVDTDTPVPGVPGKTFSSFGQPYNDPVFAYHHGFLLFEGYDFITKLNNDLHGLYVRTPTGDIHTLLTPGQTFDGKTISYWLYNRDSFDDDGITLTLHFTDGSAGIFSTDFFSALPGDTNNDRIVDLQDLNNVLNNFGDTALASLTPLQGDTNSDGVIDLADLNNVLNHFGNAAPDRTLLTPTFAGVPEPTTALLLPLLLTLPRRRRPT